MTHARTVYEWERVKCGGPLLSGSTGSTRQYRGFMQGSAPNCSLRAGPCAAPEQHSGISASLGIFNSGKLQLRSATEILLFPLEVCPAEEMRVTLRRRARRAALTAIYIYIKK